jgi:transcriptional regulator with XRE-family HTH domain
MPATNTDSPLRGLRRRRGLTLAALAGRAGLSPAFLSMVENGQRKLSRRDHVNALALALGVSPSEVAPGSFAGLDEWAAPASHAAATFPVVRDDITMARHKDSAEQFINYVIRGDGYAAGMWLRRIARDPSMNPWLLLDQLTTLESSRIRWPPGELSGSGPRRFGQVPARSGHKPEKLTQEGRSKAIRTT